MGLHHTGRHPLLPRTSQARTPHTTAPQMAFENDARPRGTETYLINDARPRGTETYLINYAQYRGTLGWHGWHGNIFNSITWYDDSLELAAMLVMLCNAVHCVL